jgi:hypothetical protein
VAKLCVCHGIDERRGRAEGLGCSKFGAMHIRGGADSAIDKTDSIDL